MSVVPREGGSAEAQLRAITRLRGDAGLGALAGTGERYAGLVTRALALALDALVVDGVALLVGVTVGLGVSLLHLPKEVDAAIAAVMGAAWIIWSVAYFVFFWSSAGQTPGARAMGIRVVDVRERGALKPRRALLRFIGLIIAAIPLLAGFWMMLWDERRRCLQDRLARTVVIYTDENE